MLTPYTDLERHALKVTMTKNFGTRMIKAREMCGLTQLQAYPLFGFANSSRLAKIECVEGYASQVTSHIIALAVFSYNVSADFLLGFSESPQRDIQQAHENQIQNLLADCIADEFAEIRRLSTALIEALEIFELFEKKTGEITQTINRFRELNPEFDDMLGGAKLARLIAELRQDAKQNTEKLIAIRDSIK